MTMNNDVTGPDHADEDHMIDSVASMSLTMPACVGSWYTPWMILGSPKRPRWLTRVMMRLFFEAEWRDEK